MTSSDRSGSAASLGSASSAPAETSAMNALSRLSARFERVEPVEQPFYARNNVLLGPASHPVADLNRLAAIWAGTQLSQIDAAHENAATLPGPAALAMHAARLGMEALCEQRDVARLGAADLPCVVLLSGGGSRLVTAILPAHSGDEACFILATSAGSKTASVAALAEAASGSIFRLRQMLQADAHEANGTEASSSTPAQRAARPNGQTEHSSVSAGTIAGFLIHAMRQRRPLLVQLIIASAVINLLGLALPLFTMAVFDRVIPHAAMETLWALAIGVCLALCLELALRHARLKLFDAVGQSASLTLQGRLIGRLLHARLIDVPRSAGGIMHPAQELDQMSNTVPQLIVSLMVDLPFFVILMIFLVSIGGPVVLAPLVGTVLMVGIHVLCHNMAHAAHAGHSNFMRRQMQAMMDSIGAQERIRVTGSGGQFLSGWERAADQAGFAAHESRYWHGLAAQAGAVIVQMVIIATVVIGVFRIDAAAMTIGALSAAILLVSRAMMPVSIFTGLVFRTIQGLQSAAPLSVLLTAEPEAGSDQRGGASQVHGYVSGQISFARVSFIYPGETRAALQDVSLSFKAGEKIGIVGRAGCGKSTLLKIIARLHEPHQGTLCLDSRDIRQYDPAFIRRAIAYMPQDAQLVDGSLEDNLTLGLPRPSRAEIERVAKISGVHDFASRHSSGYSLMVGPGGCRISGGERQSVSLARALMGQPVTLMLDEPTSAMDNALEAKVIAALKAELAGKGLIIATHRLQVLALVDRVIWMDGGRIVADGPKEDVFKKFGLVA